MTGGPRVLGTFIASGALLLVAALSPVSAQTVKITPLGSHAGELCANDRALLFEDPTGVRILYHAGRTVAGAADPRLGTVHVVLLSHAHGDHIGDTKPPGPDAGTCERLHLPLSGKTMEFDGQAQCVRGC